MILLTADWHIKLGQKGVPINWAINRYKMFFEQLKEIEKTVELHILAGDVFDRLPSMEELNLYFEWVSGVTVRTLVFAGNHEATKKGQTFLTHLKSATNKINPLVEIIDEITETDDYIIVPYEFIHKKTTWKNLNKNKVVFSHIRGEIEPHVKPEIDLELISDFPVVYLGDLHSHSNCQRNMVYPGSPMVTSFHRSRVSTGYILIDSSDLTHWEWREFNLPQLIRKTVTSEDEIIETDYDHTIYEVEGNLVDLSNIKSSELLDKKITKRKSDTALILTKDMTKGEELREYLLYILELDEATVEEALRVYNDHAARASLE